VLWSTAYYRFFGAKHGREQMPSALRPLSCGETSRVLEHLCNRHRHTARRCVAQMLASGYIPDDHNADQFRNLVEKVTRKPAVPLEDVIADLRESGLRDYAEPSAVTAGEEFEIRPDAPREPIPLPTVMTFQGDLFTARKQVLIPARYERARRIAYPENWKALGPFWEGRGSIKVDWEKPEKQIRPRIKNGTVREHFVVNWNTLLLQEFTVLLKVTQRANRDLIRTDYSLIYEEDDQLLVDQGYGEVKRIKNRPGWACYTGEKTLKFASSLLNLLAPGVMAMFLDGNVSWFYKMFAKRRSAGTRHQGRLQ
jgi:hypothetical protein